jgi:hypothetical protein
MDAVRYMTSRWSQVSKMVASTDVLSAIFTTLLSIPRAPDHQGLITMFRSRSQAR